MHAQTLRKCPVGPTCRGFTLIELVMAVVVVAILTAVALPVYTQQLQKGRRSDALKIMSAISQSQERYRSNSSSYAAKLSDLTDLANLKIDSDPNYTFDMTGADIGAGSNFSLGYTITATPRSGSPQASDSKCAKLIVKLVQGYYEHVSVDRAGNDTRSDCWPQ